MPSASVPDRALKDSIARAFRRLPPKLQIVAILALVEQQPYAEIADALELPVGTIKSRVFRATRLLRKELARLGITPHCCLMRLRQFKITVSGATCCSRTRLIRNRWPSRERSYSTESIFGHRGIAASNSGCG